MSAVGLYFSSLNTSLPIIDGLSFSGYASYGLFHL
nr:MAG TPA: hypothetical protein [Crassvirales sp.]